MEYLRGFKGPLTFQANGDLAQVEDIDALATDLFQIIDDRKKEWLFQANHGLTIFKSVMSQKDSIFALQIETLLRKETIEQEPRVRVKSVTVNTEPAEGARTIQEQIDLEHTAAVRLEFQVGATGKDAVVNLQIQRG